jgi:ferric-dicitrate binding protein FerR (iron transport regulator)
MIPNGWSPDDPDAARLYDRFRAGLAALELRVAGLEAGRAAVAARGEQRRTRLWTLILSVAAGLICPLAVTAILAWLHVQ